MLPVPEFFIVSTWILDIAVVSVSLSFLSITKSCSETSSLHLRLIYKYIFPDLVPYCCVSLMALFQNIMSESLVLSIFMYVSPTCFLLGFPMFVNCMFLALEIEFHRFSWTFFLCKMSSSFASILYCKCLAQPFRYSFGNSPYKNPFYPNKYLSAYAKRGTRNFLGRKSTERWSDVVSGWFDVLLFGKVSFGSKSKGGWFFSLELG